MSNNDELIVDALETGVVKDYNRLIQEFGIEPLSDVIDAIPESKQHIFMKRGVMFGHTDLKQVIECINNSTSFAVMTGIKPSGQYHVGSLTTASEVVYFQQLGGRVSFCIADIESYVSSGLSFDKAAEIAIDNIADLFALGLDPNPDNTFIYSQSEEKLVQKYGHIFSSHVTLNTLKSIYGEKLRVGYYNAALIQVADILLPQIRWGSMPTVTPIGADQAPHARLTRDIARKEVFQEEFKFKLPSFTYHTMLQGIDGSEKMSKSVPMSVFSMDEDIKDIHKKINNALTGGRDTAAEQREKGANPEVCRVFDLFKFMFESDDKRLTLRMNQCKSGELLCGPCKKDLKQNIEEFQQNHLEKKSQMIELSTELIRNMKN
ncbi:MAG: tryptophan--tRNA ligase [Candidatus Heimdallarchaeota archaeon]|nr:tryptophan--tRNA ligase [Candidatus Heimdallarchaeota archaeon]MDH5645457.1 tryptophan--tRNA ligase [Candidatus Heimdallarchaeota archaeon]